MGGACARPLAVRLRRAVSPAASGPCIPRTRKRRRAGRGAEVVAASRTLPDEGDVGEAYGMSNDYDVIVLGGEPPGWAIGLSRACSLRRVSSGLPARARDESLT